MGASCLLGRQARGVRGALLTYSLSHVLPIKYQAYSSISWWCVAQPMGNVRFFMGSICLCTGLKTKSHKCLQLTSYLVTVAELFYFTAGCRIIQNRDLWFLNCGVWDSHDPETTPGTWVTFHATTISRPLTSSVDSLLLTVSLTIGLNFMWNFMKIYVFNIEWY